MSIRNRLRLAAIAVSTLAAACGNTATSNEAACADNPVGCICRNDSACGGANPRCELRTGKCVPCLPESDNCGGGLRCLLDGTTRFCGTGCLTTADCPTVGGARQQCCDKVCIDTTRSAANCGACGTVCGGLPNAGAACAGGGCVVDKCTAGFADCDGSSANGCETGVTADVKHCGACGTVCTAGPNATPGCAAGSCTTTCVEGFANCDGRPENGCEVDVTSDQGNCGACGAVCGTLPNAGSTLCRAGKCEPASCVGWFGDCNKSPGDGCEADTQSDVNNCGGCGLACPLTPNGVGGCRSGVCVIESCNAGYDDCDHAVGNGCELPTLSDPANCGGCGVSCVGANGAQSCSAGACQVAACNAGFLDCDHAARSGCEVNVNSDVSNCNGCGNACSPPAHAAAACVLGVCGAGACVLGFANCNGDGLDGCEVDITTVDNCGGCGNACAVPANASPRCLGARCTIGMCNPGYANCDNDDGNGCERNLDSDPQSCGVCGNVCSYKSASGACAGGKCMMGKCDAGKADCNKSDVDGCEQSVAADPMNCGACGNVCPQDSPYCVNSACSASTHSTAQLAWDFQSFQDGCGNYSVWYSQDLGMMTWDDCEAAANKYGAMLMGETGWFGGYAAPYQSDERWVGEADLDNAWVSTDSWDTVRIDGKGQKYKCVLAYANGQEHGVTELPNQLVADNGKTYVYDDLGDIDEAQCYSQARDAGARTLNPWLFNGVKQSTAFMVENHLCHGSVMYDGLASYASDGNSDHFYRCFIGYNP